MTIQSLIDKRDTFEIVRDQIAGVLAAETAAQQVLAAAEDPPRDPREWALRVFLERTDPWSEFQDGADDTLDVTPIVNVTYDSSRFDLAGGNVIDRQRGQMRFNVDVYAYGVAADDGAEGHTPGDLSAALNLGRATRLVRNILMASEYVLLGLAPAVISRRWIESVSIVRPAPDEPALEKVQCARIVFEVLANEFSPQYEGVPLELIDITVRRENGEVVINAQVDTTADS